jgi:hypothetical protein
MTDYESLPTVIGEMKRAACDSFMSDNGWPVDVFDDRFYSLWGVIAASSYHRPYANGEGGGAAWGVSSWGDSMAPSFDSIRADIDEIVSPWLGLPDGSQCTAPRLAASSAASIFGASGTGGSIQDNAEIVTSNQTVADVLITNIQGSFTAPFHDKYYAQFAKVAAGLGAASAILEMNYAAQAGIWPAARADALTLCENAREALRADAGESAAEYGKVALTVVGAVAGAVATVATAGAAAPAVAVLVGLSTVATGTLAGIEATATISGSGCNAILASLSDALSTLNSGIAAQEGALNTLLSSTIATIDSNLASFNLDAFSMADYPGAAGPMSMQQYHADMITTNMNRVSSAMASAASALGVAPSSNPSARDYRIGAGASGTYTNAYELHDLTAQCLSRTMAEYERGLALFQATVADYFSTDADAESLVKSLVADEALTAEM